jgi:hypothetical protein
MKRYRPWVMLPNAYNDTHLKNLTRLYLNLYSNAKLTTYSFYFVITSSFQAAIIPLIADISPMETL